jgi:hypothetical protein
MKISTMALPRLVVVTAGCLAALLSSPSVSGQTRKESFSGFAINLNSVPRTAVIDFTITRWSTDDERHALLAIIGEEKNPTQKLLKALQKMKPVGRIRTTNTLGWDLRYAHEAPLDQGGRRIVLATDRPIGFWEARNQGRTMDYPFTLIEIRLGKDDRGEGKILAGTKIHVDDKKHLVLENYGQQPVRFNEIRPLH